MSEKSNRGDDDRGGPPATGGGREADGAATTDGADENHLVRQRRDKLALRREAGVAFPNAFRPTHRAAALHAEHDGKEKPTLEAEAVRVAVAGRVMTQRVMGKASFVTMRDGSGDIQLFASKGALGDERYAAFVDLDLGDIVGVRGTMFMTNRGELTVEVAELELLTKALRPLPDKFHGLQDQETRYRRRYLDLIANEETRRVFRLRSAVVAHVRAFFVERDYLEVETPMMHVIPGGAAAKPFTTHHNALDIDLYLRIAPELYLKRLVVGGFERVFEINRNFRNEGLSTRHNPEFTMLEFYQAYATYHELMDLTEELFRELARDVVGSTSIASDDGSRHYDFGSPFARTSLFDAILAHNPGTNAESLATMDGAGALAASLGVKLEDAWGLGRVQTEIFEASVEEKLLDPTFVTLYPAEVSPLARRSDDDPFVTDRFELFVGGREIANGFSELNDAEDQAARFREQVAGMEAGDEEAMHYDADYVRALEHGLPPTAGEGIGIDRLVMLLAGVPSIRDVVLFPHMRPAAP